MNRRGFLWLLGSVAATAVLDPERLLWVPGAKTISVAMPQRHIVEVAEQIIFPCRDGGPSQRAVYWTAEMIGDKVVSTTEHPLELHQLANCRSSKEMIERLSMGDFALPTVSYFKAFPQQFVPSHSVLW